MKKGKKKNEEIKNDVIKNEEQNMSVENYQHEENNKTQNQPKVKKKRTINGISIWRILAYFIIYSVLGYMHRNYLWSDNKRRME